MSGSSHAGLREADARAAAEDDDFGLQLRPAARNARRPGLRSALRPRRCARRGSSMTTLCVIFSPSTPTQPGPIAGDGSARRICRAGASWARAWCAALKVCELWSNYRFSPCRRRLRRGFENRPEIRQARQRPLRHPRPHHGCRPADGGRGPQDHQAEHRQPRRVRLRRARGNPAGHDPQPAQLGGLFGQQGHLRGAQGRDALHPEAGHQGRHARRHLPGQRRERADRDGHQRAAERRRRTAAAGARLPAVDRRDEPVGRHAGALPVRRGQRLDARPRRHPRARSRRAPRASSSSTPTTRPARCTPTSCSRASSRSRASTAW